MTLTVDFDRPYKNIDKEKDPDFIEQDGIIFAWSESNIRYERAWWLSEDVTPTSLVTHLRETRNPFIID